MVNTIQYSSGAKELHRFQHVLPSKFNSFGHQFPRSGPHHIRYMISPLYAWSNPQNLELRQSVMTDPSELLGDFSVEPSTCLQEFDLPSQDNAKVYGDKN